MVSVGGANNTDMRNYAYSGAMIDNVRSLFTIYYLSRATTLPHPQNLYAAQVPDVKAQISSFVADVASGLVSPLPPGGKTLVAVWAG